MDRLSFNVDDTATGPYGVSYTSVGIGLVPAETRPTVPRWHGGAPVYDADGARICGALTCGDTHFARGRCRRHYHRLRARGLL